MANITSNFVTHSYKDSTFQFFEHQLQGTKPGAYI